MTAITEGASGSRQRFPALPGWAITTAGIVAFLLLWEVVARTLLAGSYIIAAPSEIVARIDEGAALYGRALRTTLWAALLGFLIGNATAILLAGVASLAARAERLVQALALVVFCLPLVATGPILRVIFGPGIGPQVTLAALAVYYTTLIPLLVGFKAVPSSWPDLVASYGRGRFQTLIHVRARASIPYLVAGLQIAAPAAFLGAMVGEFTGAERGLGVLTIQAIRTLDVAGTWAIAVIATVTSIAGYVAIGWVGKRFSHGAPPVLLAAPPTPDRSAPGRRIVTGVLAVVLTTVVAIGLWWALLELFDLHPFFAKRPSDVWNYLFNLPASGANRERVLSALAETLSVTVPGYIAGLVIGFLAACLFELYPAAGRAATPIAIALRSIPIIATAPLIVLAFGRGAFGMLIIVGTLTFFPTLVAVAQGLRQTPGQVVDLFGVYRAGGVRTLVTARIPSALPAFFAAARMAVPAAVLAATVAEWLATGTGIGNLMALTASTSAYNLLWSCVVVLTLVSVAGYGLVALVERYVLHRFAPEQLR
ncbi:MAG: ABC transporter permease subunit [Bauldia sp.]|nr:ABC transporter permease subunit [Bauldia sp.]